MDEQLLVLLNQTIASPPLDLLMLGLTWGGFAALPGLGVALLVGPQRRLGRAILAALGGSLVLVLVLQQLGGRARPDDVRLLISMPNFPAYPSGHAAAAFAVAVVWGLHYRQLRQQIPALILASLIALSRVYLGVHYPSDALGGALLGAAVGAASYGLLLDEGAGRWRWMLWPQVALVLAVTQMAYLDALPRFLLGRPYVDKVLHFLLFGMVAFWLNLWLDGRRMAVAGWGIPLAILIPITLAMGEEMLQAFSPLRTADLGDLASDLAGMGLFWWLSERWRAGVGAVSADGESRARSG